MLNRSIIIKLCVLISIFSPTTLAKSWKGVTPLRSTAQDVAHLSQVCAQTETRCQFTLEDQEVMIIFSGSKIGDLECPRVPTRTVLAIIVRFSQPRKLREFQIPKRQAKTFDPSSPPKRGYKTYYYLQEGFMINTYRGQVIGLVYIAEQKDIQLCPEYYADPKAFVEVGLFPEDLFLRISQGFR